MYDQAWHHTPSQQQQDNRLGFLFQKGNVQKSAVLTQIANKPNIEVKRGRVVVFVTVLEIIFTWPFSFSFFGAVCLQTFHHIAFSS